MFILSISFSSIPPGLYVHEYILLPLFTFLWRNWYQAPKAHKKISIMLLGIYTFMKSLNVENLWLFYLDPNLYVLTVCDSNFLSEVILWWWFRRNLCGMQKAENDKLKKIKSIEE